MDRSILVRPIKSRLQLTQHSIIASPQARWWAVAIVILIVGAGLRFTGYNFQLPFRYIEPYDEPHLFMDSLIYRGLDHRQPMFPGYPPGIIWVDSLAQIVVEQLTHQSVWDKSSDAVALVRFWAAATGLITGLIIGLLARRMGGNWAGWLAMAAWLSLPIPNFHTVRELPAAWVVFLCALALYWAVLGLKRDWAGWPILSVLAGLGAVLFKYSEFLVLAPGIVVTLWRLRSSWRKWSLVLGVQIACIVLLALWLFLGYGAGVMFQNQNPAKEFIQDGPNRMLDLQLQSTNLFEAVSQVSVSPWLFVMTTVVGTALFCKRSDKTLAWVFVLGYGVGMVALVTGYLRPVELLLFRYTAPASIAFAIVLSISIIEIAAWLGKHLAQPWLAGALAASAAILWITPASLHTWGMVSNRARPETRAALMAWSIENMGPGSIIVNKDNSQTFSKEWAGYPGPYRVFVVEDITTKALEQWISNSVNYVILSDAQLDELRKRAQGREYLNHILLLKHFPPPGEAEKWQGPSINVFRLWRMQNELNAQFGDSILLTGFDLKTNASVIDLTLYWRALRPAKDNYNVYLHFVPVDTRRILSQADGAPSVPGRPTLTWLDTNETLISPEFKIAVPPDLPNGCYRLLVGLYNFSTGERLQIGRDDFLSLPQQCLGTAWF